MLPILLKYLQSNCMDEANYPLIPEWFLDLLVIMKTMLILFIISVIIELLTGCSLSCNPSLQLNKNLDGMVESVGVNCTERF